MRLCCHPMLTPSSSRARLGVERRTGKSRLEETAGSRGPTDYYIGLQTCSGGVAVLLVMSFSLPAPQFNLLSEACHFFRRYDDADHAAALEQCSCCCLHRCTRPFFLTQTNTRIVRAMLERSNFPGVHSRVRCHGAPLSHISQISKIHPPTLSLCLCRQT